MAPDGDSVFQPCPNCGESVPAPIATCPFCGSRIRTDASAAPEPEPAAPAEEFDFSDSIDPAALETLDRAERRRRLRSMILSGVVILGSIVVVAAVFLWPSGDEADVAATPAAADEPPREVALDFTPRVGDCLDIEQDGEVVERSCDRRHDAEMYASAPYRGEASGYPGRAAIEAFADEACLGAFGDYVGVEYYYSGLDMSYFWPDSGSWAEGDRTVECLAQDLAGQKLDAPVRGSGGIAHPGFLPPGPAAVGHCLNADAVMAALTPTVSCEAPHDFEVFAVVQHSASPGEAWPGEAALDALAASCEAEPFEKYVGIAYDTSSLVAGWIIPSADTWGVGDRTTVCLLMTGAGEQLAGWMQGSGDQTALGEGPHFDAAELREIVLQTYEPPPGTEHRYSTAMSGDEWLAWFDAPADIQLVPDAVFLAEFSTPGLAESTATDPVPAEAVNYVISAKAFATAKDASIEIGGSQRLRRIDAAGLTEIPADIGDESWAAHVPESAECHWRIGNLMVSIYANGPATDLEVMLDIAESTAARAAGAEVRPRPAPASEVEAAIWEADAALIATLFEGESMAWADGTEAAVRYAVDHSYPGLDVTFESCMDAWYPDGPQPGLAIDYRADPATAIADDGWTLPDGKLAGQPLGGRVYVVEVTETVTEDGVTGPPVIASLHATIIDGEAYAFWRSCGP